MLKALSATTTTPVKQLKDIWESRRPPWNRNDCFPLNESRLETNGCSRGFLIIASLVRKSAATARRAEIACRCSRSALIGISRISPAMFYCTPVTPLGRRGVEGGFANHVSAFPVTTRVISVAGI